MRYDFQAIEQRWQAHWEQHRTFRAANPGQPGFDPSRPKFYVLDMFPYPSGVGLHVGHPLGYIATDIVARYKRMKGFNVLHPMGYDAFGLPAEQFAVTHGVHPRITTQDNTENMTRQLKRLGLSYDWDRCFSTTDVDYYRWTQWIFLQLFNSYFDPVAQRARPIAALLDDLANERYLIDLEGDLVSQHEQSMAVLGGGEVGLRRWQDLTKAEQRQVIDDLRLAYLAEVPVNWCPALGTVLANEEVTNEGRSERGNHPVFRRPLKQWMLRITAYAPRLIADLDRVDWPEAIKLMQRNWIGKSDGARVDFTIAYGSTDKADDVITVFTTRPDTLFGATYMVLAPEHPLVDQITTAEQLHAVTQYRRQVAARSEADRAGDDREKTGVFTGAYALNPVNNHRIPIWIADYVLMGYGTGAIMAVPAHDPRDFAFARQFGLPITAVVMPDDAWLLARAQAAGLGDSDTDSLRNWYIREPAAFQAAFTGEGTGLNSANSAVSLNDLPTPQAKAVITRWLEAQGLGRGQTQYKLRDWLFSRQRYWGEPFPILHAPDGRVVPLDESELPVELPAMEDFSPHAGDDPDAPVQTPLSRAPESWRLVQRDGVTYTRELNTMPQWAGSCWYYLRFIDPRNSSRFVDPAAERYWMGQGPGSPSAGGGVDLYVGGAEHAVLHLLYARFWHKVLHDLGHVSSPEPFARLFNQGYIQAYAYVDARGVYVPAAEVTDQDGKPALEVQTEPGRRFFHKGQPVTQEYGKMGKSLQNAIAPDEVCEQYGCDTLRLYEMYLGPLDQSKAWNTRDIIGVHRFLLKVWRNFIAEDGGLKVGEEAAPPPLRRLLHKTIRKVGEDMERLSFNTAIAALIELNNELVGMARLPREVAENMVLLLAPLAPHIAEELWQRLGRQTSLAQHPWPAFDPGLVVDQQVEYPVQVNGKLRGRVTVPADADDDALRAAALADAKVQQALAGKPVKKVIIVKGKMVNLIVAG